MVTNIAGDVRGVNYSCIGVDLFTTNDCGVKAVYTHYASTLFSYYTNVEHSKTLAHLVNRARGETY